MRIQNACRASIAAAASLVTLAGCSASSGGASGGSLEKTDIVIDAFPAIDSAVLAREIPRSQLAIYPDSGHALLFQYPEQFANDVSRFLTSN